MKIALIGHGNMGQEIEKLLEENKKHTIVSISYKKDNLTLDKKGTEKADVAIDFTAPSIVMKNIEEVASLGVPMVIGTTGWYDQISTAESLIKKHKGGLIYGKNFSVGANIFFQIIASASTLFHKYGGYDVYGYELHHTGKKDSPSGTAKTIAQVIMEHFPNKKTLQSEKLDRKIKEDELHFASVRGGRNPGYHEVVFDSPADEVKLVHAAHSRRGFAQGAILAAEFIQGKKGIYSFETLFKEGKLA